MTDPKSSSIGGDAVSFVQSAAILRRHLGDNLEEVQVIYNYGAKKLPDLDAASQNTMAVMKGSADALHSHYRNFNNIWADLGRLYDSNNRSAEFPSEVDLRMKKDIRQAYYASCGTIESVSSKLAAGSSRPHGESIANITATESRPMKNLPRLNLPTFDGKLLDWPRFRDTYLSIVHEDKALSSVERFQYLRVSLKGPAFSVISNLRVEEANYTVAWQALLDTYDNKRMLAAAYMDQLLNYKPLQVRATPAALNNFLSTISDTIAAFQLLEITDEAQFILFHLTVRLLDAGTRELFEMKFSRRDTFPTFTQLTDFVRDRCLALQLADTTHHLLDATQSPNNKQTYTRGKQPPKAKNQSSTTLLVNKDSDSPAGASSSTPRRNANTNSERSSCSICHQEAHALINCRVFNDKSTAERIALLKSWNGCVNCLSPSHKVSTCTSKWHCRFCSTRHHSMLHPPPPVQDDSKSQIGFTAFGHGTSITTSTTPNDYVLLGTAIAKIRDSRGHFQDVRLVIDSASQNSFITHRCCNRLGLRVANSRKKISGIGETLFDGAKGITTCVIKPRGHSSTSLTTEAMVVTTITSHLPSTTLPREIVSRFDSIELADPYFWKPGAVDFLLGADLFTDIWTGVVKETDIEGPRLLSSIFGFIVMGKVSSQSPTSTSLLVANYNNSDDLNLQLERFWELESPTPKNQIINPDDQRCEDHFLRTHYRLKNGRYVVHLPFKENNPEVGDSSFVALKRFYNLERKLKNDTVTREKYHEFLNEYRQLNHMSPAQSLSKFMIPHHGITRDSPGGGKLKVVFDASVNVPGGSLNQHLLTGCKLQNDIRDIILRFRSHVVAFSTDLVKMFRMIEVHPPDRQYLQIYWRFHPSEQVQRYELNTVIYGLVCAPWIAQRVLHQLTIDHKFEYPLAANVLLHDSYVDDILTGAPTAAEAIELQNQLIGLLKCGCFDLSKWSSNSSEILSNVQHRSQMQPVDLSSPEEQWVKILGLQWDPHLDCFSFTIGEPNPNFTKRGVLSTVARIYDPLGFLTPTTPMMKGFIQELWIKKLDWDEPLTDDLIKSWKQITSELP